MSKWLLNKYSSPCFSRTTKYLVLYVVERNGYRLYVGGGSLTLSTNEDDEANTGLAVSGTWLGMRVFLGSRRAILSC